MNEEDLKEMFNAGAFIINLVNNQDLDERIKLLKQNVGAMVLLTEIDNKEKVRILQEVMLKFLEKKDEGATPELRYIG